MRLSDRHLKIIKEVEADGYVWLSHLSKNAQYRFRYKTARGFKGYYKVEGLTFLTKRVANALELGASDGDRKKLTVTQQLAVLEKQLYELERELYQLKGVGIRKVKRRYKDEW